MKTIEADLEDLRARATEDDPTGCLGKIREMRQRSAERKIGRDYRAACTERENPQSSVTYMPDVSAAAFGTIVWLTIPDLSLVLVAMVYAWSWFMAVWVTWPPTALASPRIDEEEDDDGP
jgi:hypothetical protein